MDTRFQLQAGDIVGAKNPQCLGTIIRIGEILQSESLKAEYTHSIIIETPEGGTIEAVWKIERQNLFTAYKGEQVCIARWKDMTPAAYQKGYDAIKNQIGDIYPYSRLFLDLFGLGKFLKLSKDDDCVELAAQFLIGCGADLLCGTNYKGLTPQQLVDEFRISKFFDIIFEGIL
jgi:hypothetical protein